MTATLFVSKPRFACRYDNNVAAVSGHTKDHAIENVLSEVYFGHGEEIHGHALHGLVRHWRPLGLPLVIPIVGIADLTDESPFLDLLDGIVETNLVDFDSAVHLQGLLLHPWLQHVRVQRFA